MPIVRIIVFAWLVFVCLAFIGGCGGDRLRGLANTDPRDATLMPNYPDATGDGAVLLSAFFGLDDGIAFIASYRICGSIGLADGMPVVFAKEIDISSLEAGDFQVTLADGRQVAPGCVTPAPAEDVGEFRTILMLGDFGSVDNQPRSVEVVGNLVSLDQRTNFRNAQVEVTALEQGPSLIWAEPVKDVHWEIGKASTNLPFGGGTGCPERTQQIIRVVWSGGVTKPGGGEVDELERSAYRVLVRGETGAVTAVTPFALADLGDRDNNHKLCLDFTTPVLGIEFPAELLTDPRDDLNPATSVRVSYP